MAHPRGAMEGIERNGISHRHHAAPSNMRLPTVDEALPFSPFSSIVPFDSGLITAPGSEQLLSPSMFTDAEEQKTAKEVLAQLNASASGAESASRRCQQTIRDVQRLLNPDGLMQFLFKPREAVSRGLRSSNISPQSPAKLSPFAKMVLEGTNVSYRYTDSASAQRAAKHDRSQRVPPSPSNLPETPLSNGHAAVGSAVSVVIPSIITPDERAQYAFYPNPDPAKNQYELSPTKQRAKATNGVRHVSIDQRHRSDQAVNNLQSLLNTIIEGEDAAQGDMNVDEDATLSAMFTSRETDDGVVLVLQPERLRVLDSSLQKVASAHRFDDLDITDLNRIQKLCERAVAPIQSVPLSIEEDWSENDTEEWLIKMAHAESGLIAARIIMRIMAGLPQTKELQSESLLQEILLALENIIGGCILPLVEMPSYTGEKIRGQKEAPPGNPKFVIASANRQTLQSFLTAATKDLRSLGVLLNETDFEESNVAKVESLCEMLIFAQNASVERESVLGIQNFESMRRSAMDVLTKIFTKYEQQRDGILSEVLSSLSKLPATKQSARQYRLTDSKPIQLVSALLMMLVQTSACATDSDLKGHHDLPVDQDSDDDEDADGSTDEEGEMHRRSGRNTTANDGMVSTVLSLNRRAVDHSRYIAHMLVERALTATKTGDEPYRKLLDIFVDDFLNVLGSTDWPAAEQLLHSLFDKLFHIAATPKRPAPARTMALEFLGIMGSGILEMQMAARDAARAVEDDSNHRVLLASLVDQALSGKLDSMAVIAFGGPYRILLEHLGSGTDLDPQVQTSRGYRLTEWFSIACGDRAPSVGSDDSDGAGGSGQLKKALISMIHDPQWLSEHSQIDAVSDLDARLASKILTLNSKFCRSFNRILNTLLGSMSNEQPTVRSRSLKSIDTLLEKDPSVLESNHLVSKLTERTMDASPLVRDSALGLVSKCLTLRPDLDASVLGRILPRTSDSASGVQQRAIKVLKDIYLRNENSEMRSVIAAELLKKTRDVEAKVAELARLTVEEILFQPFYGLELDGDGTVQARIAYSGQAGLLVQMLADDDDLSSTFDTLLRRLQRKSKAVAAFSRVCKTLIAVMFDGFINSEDIAGAPSQERILLALSVFAKASPKLFTAPQLERLAPYLENLETNSDLWTCRFAITIFRYTMPHQTHLKPDTVGGLQPKLLKVITKAPIPQLKELAEEVASCTWTITGIIGGTGTLANFVKSIIVQLSKLVSEDLIADATKAAKATRMSYMVGEFGKACDFSAHLPEWKPQFPWYKGNSVPGLMVELLCRFVSPKRPLQLRVAVLTAICSISQAWSAQFLRADVTNAFEVVFQEQSPELEGALLAGLEVFFGAQEKPKDDDLDDAEGQNGVASGKERLGRTYQASDDDKALTSMSQRFLDPIRRLALADRNEPAFIAARLIITINSQGLGHPKDSAPALVALETCMNADIAKRAFDAHKDQGLSRESLFEKEYMRGVQLAFEYQQRVEKEVVGYRGQPAMSKLKCLWEVLKNGKAGVRNKFLGNMSKKLDFVLTEITQQHMLFAHFCLGNLAFFDYEKVDELLALKASLEKVFSATGTVVAQAIESEVLHIHMEGLIDSVADDMDMGMPVQPPQPALEPQRLKTLSLAGQTLSLIWETRSFLVRLWSLQKHAAKAKKPVKESGNAKNVYRATNAQSLTETYIKTSGDLAEVLDTEDKQRQMCSSFVELFTVDHEVKVGSEDDAAGDVENGYATPSEDGSSKSGGSHPPGSGRGRKRKSSVQAGPAPKKRGRPSFGKRKSVSFRSAGDEDDDRDDDDYDGGWN